MATERSLPEGWTRSIDPSTELPYYHNAALGESRWEPPGAPEGAEGDDAPMPAPPVPDDPAVRRLRVGTEQLTTKGAAKRLKRRMKQKGVDHNVFRWT